MTLRKLFLSLSQDALSPNQNRLIDHATIDLYCGASGRAGRLNYAAGPCQLVNRRPIRGIHSGYLFGVDAQLSPETKTFSAQGIGFQNAYVFNRSGNAIHGWC
jgi:hypothetical protein